MSKQTLKELKRFLMRHGFEVYRTKDGSIHLAERPRENLIMDSGVRLTGEAPHAVSFIVRAEASRFPNEEPDALFARAREVGAEVAAGEYAEVSADEQQILDPGDKSKVIDRWFQVTFRREVGELDASMTELRRVLACEKVAS